jgi:hypothetical protein
MWIGTQRAFELEKEAGSLTQRRADMNSTDAKRTALKTCALRASAPSDRLSSTASAPRYDIPPRIRGLVQL